MLGEHLQIPPEVGSIKPAYAKDSQFYISNKKQATGKQEASQLKKNGEKKNTIVLSLSFPPQSSK